MNKLLKAKLKELKKPYLKNIKVIDKRAKKVLKPIDEAIKKIEENL